MIDLLLYVLTFGILSYLTANIIGTSRGKILSRLLAVASGTCLLMVAGFYWATQAIEIPSPTGPYQVSLSHWQINTERPETDTLMPGDQRVLHLKVWYPTADVSDIQFKHYAPTPKQAAYVSPGMAQIHADLFDRVPILSFLKAPLINNLNAARLEAFAGTAPLKTSERFPVLLFSPGYQSHIDLFATTMHEVASHGYIVIGINHSFEANPSILPNGLVLSRTDQTMEHLPALSKQDYQRYEQQLTRFHDTINRIPEERLLKDKETDFFNAYNGMVNIPQGLTGDLTVRSADLLSTISFMEKAATAPNASALIKLMDLSRVGAFGMSFGGPTAAEFCRSYGKCLAAANLDGQNWGKMLAEPLDVPYLWITRADTKNERFDTQYTQKHWRADAYRIYVPGTTHIAFTDAPFLSPVINLMAIRFPYNIAPGNHAEQVHRVSNAAIVNLFDHYTKGKNLNLNQLTETLPDLIVETYPH